MNAPPITNYRPARRRHPINRQPAYLAAGGLACFAVVAVIGLSGVEIGSPLASPEQRAVREYLKNNLDNPSFSEVQWSEVEPAFEGRTTIILTYRTVNPFGGMSIHCHRFYIKDGRAESHWESRQPSRH